MKVNKITEDTKKSFTVRITTALALLLIGVPAIIFGDWFFFIFVLVAAVLAIIEFLNAPRKPKINIIVKIFSMVMTLSFIYWIFVKNTEIASVKDNMFLMNDMRVSTMGFAVLIGGLFLLSLMYEDFGINEVCYVSTMSLLIGVGIQSIYFLRYCPVALTHFNYSNQFLSCLLFIYVVGGALLCDAGGYITGILLGKHKINPRISPKKTWEGFVGGMCISTILSFSFALICDSLNTPILKGYLDIEHWYWVLLVSVIIAVISVLGDFMFSAIKRHFNIKDFGNLLPGHGGVLDRFDSVIVTCLAVTLVLLTIINFPFIS